MTTPTLIVMLASTASFVPGVTSTTVRAELTSVTSPTPAHDRVCVSFRDIFTTVVQNMSVPWDAIVPVG